MSAQTITSVSHRCKPGTILRMSSINQFPWHEPIVEILRDRGPATVDSLAHELAGDGGDVDSLRKQVADEADHLVLIGVARDVSPAGSTDRTLELI